MTDNNRGERLALVMRWTARVLGTLVGGVYLFVLIVSAFDGSEPLTLEGAILGVLILVAVLGVVMVWWRERQGATILVADGLALGVFALLTAGRNRGLAVLVSGAPFIFAGLLLLASRKIREDR